MLDIKQLLSKITNWINAYKPPHYEYVSNVGSTLFNNTWTAPDDGMLVMVGVSNNSGNLAYWYVNDVTQNDIQLGTLVWQSANNTRRSTSFPIIKGHQYNSPNKSAIQTANAYFYKLVGGVARRLFDLLTSERRWVIC